MGLSIRYSLKFKGSEKEVKDILDKVRRQVSMLPVKKLGPVKNLSFAEDPGKTGLVFRCLVGEGCESTNIGLISKDRNNWRGDASTKTQYAEHFYLSHTMVCDILDICRTNGILNDVNDQGQFWETRNPKVLATNINKSTRIIMAMSKKFSEIFEMGKFKFPIDKNKNFMIVEDKEDD